VVITFGDYAGRWLTNRKVKGLLAMRTREGYQDVLRRFLLPTFGARPTHTIGCVGGHVLMAHSAEQAAALGPDQGASHGVGVGVGVRGGGSPTGGADRAIRSCSRIGNFLACNGKADHDLPCVIVVSRHIGTNWARDHSLFDLPRIPGDIGCESTRPDVAQQHHRPGNPRQDRRGQPRHGRTGV
jgi:hypothetical protein